MTLRDELFAGIRATRDNRNTHDARVSQRRAQELALPPMKPIKSRFRPSTVSIPYDPTKPLQDEAATSRIRNNHSYRRRDS